MIKSNIQTPDNKGFSIAIEVSRDVDTVCILDDVQTHCEFSTNYRYWNSMANYRSTNNYDDDYFRKIVDMKEAAVPGILEIIQDHPDPIVYALDKIYPNYMEYHGLVSLEDVCKIWIITLLNIGIR